MKTSVIFNGLFLYFHLTAVESETGCDVVRAQLSESYKHYYNISRLPLLLVISFSSTRVCERLDLDGASHVFKKLATI